MTAPRTTGLPPEIVAQLLELADLKAGIPSHQHTTRAGAIWRCTSPYCDRGGDIRDDPQPGPHETDEQAERYRRGRNA